MTELAGVSSRLPRGRHGLPREQVIASQRERILRAMADAMAERGYVNTPIAVVLKRAGVSRETFYEQFRSKEHCFEAAFERAVHGVMGRIAAASDETTPAPGTPENTDRLDRLLGAYLEALAAEPAYARLFLVEVYAAGAKAVAKRAVLQESFVAVIADVLGATTESQRFACQTLAAGVSAMVTAKIAAADPDGLRALRGPLLELVLRSGDLYGDAVRAN
ncbi:TetR/AcrR family transcriptional regulator [Nocardia bovistercoris]|uniref:TetR/AcrR family transcriptional regulator n=1 Tax=Nocardia bovistercoris TaxID=2785916 RepID=A0A931N4Q3_9NOCA|nr:TetR/AcrR family transcriptional regulator [Nocardia bovistercoris]MBH0778942.1 TetR/AcrR family transcriptional regulator [Nocardia bovistercoris]